MDWVEKLGSVKRTEFVREMQRKQTDGTYAAQPKTLTKNLGKLDTQIRHLESGDGATRVLHRNSLLFGRLPLKQRRRSYLR
jgi:hypothetical protein